MGISFDKDLRVTSLIMEPFDYTLNHYLHQMVSKASKRDESKIFPIINAKKK